MLEHTQVGDFATWTRYAFLFKGSHFLHVSRIHLTRKWSRSMSADAAFFLSFGEPSLMG